MHYVLLWCLSIFVSVVQVLWCKANEHLHKIALHTRERVSCILKEPYASAKEPYASAEEFHVLAKEPCVPAKEP